MGGLFGLSSGTVFSSFDYSALQDYYLAKSLAKNPGSVARKKADPPSAVFAPWAQKPTLTTSIARLRDALSASSFVDVRDTEINRVGIDADHKKLFAMYKGLARLQALATRAAEEGALPGERMALNKRFQAGLTEIKTFLADKGFEDLAMIFGEKVAKVDSEFRKPRPPSLYAGPPIVTGTSTDAIAGLVGTEVFTVTVSKSGATHSVVMDLSEIPGTLSVDSLVAYMNGKLETAGVYTRFQKTTQPGKTENDPKRFGFGVQTIATERVGFSAAETKPSIFLGGVAGSGSAQAGQLVKLTDDGGKVVSNFTKKISATNGVADVRGTATDFDGNVFVVGSATGDVDVGIVQGSQDAYLRKYDAAGQLIWSRLLGSSQSATGYAVAVDASGNVAIAGKVSDRLTSTSVGGGQDSFVAKYDAEGREVFTRQISPVSDDEANAIAFASDGSLLVAGQTNSALSASVTHAGASDAYLMKLSSTGSLEWARQFGGAGDDRATALAIDADGNAVLGTVESGEAVVRKLSIADGTSAAIWEMNLGSLGQGQLSSVAVGSGAVYVSGSTTNAALDASGQAAIVTAHGGSSDGFVTKITDNGLSSSAAFTTYVGTAGSESGLGLAVSGGAVYLAGSTSGNLSGTATSSSSDAFVRKLDANGNTVWTQQFESAAGASAARSISVDAQGASVLDTLGLPRGKIAFDEAQSLTAGSSVRAGDHFFVRINEGAKFKITVAAGETMRSLARKINNVMLLKGSAEVSRTGGDGIKISAKEGNVIELIAGSKGFDALAGLGFEPLKLDNLKKSTTSTAASKTFALGLKLDLAIEDKLKANTTTYQLGSAMEVIKGAYLALTGTTLSPTGGLDQRALNSYRSALGALGK